MDQSKKNEIYRAVASKKIEELQKALEGVAKVEEVFGATGFSALALAVKNQSLEMVQLLLEKGADPFEVAPDAELNNPNIAYFLALSSTNADIKNAMLKAFPINGYVNTQNQTILSLCIINGFDAKPIGILLKNGADSNLLDAENKTAFHHAILSSPLEIVELLLENGADPRMHNQEGKNALHILMLNTEVKKFDPNKPKEEISELVKTTHLLLKKCNVNAKDYSGNTALHYAAQEKLYDVAQVLIAKGANVNIANKEEQTPMHIAASKADFDFVKLLLGAGTDLWVQDVNGNLPLHLVLKKDIEISASHDHTSPRTDQCFEVSMLMLANIPSCLQFMAMDKRNQSVISIIGPQSGIQVRFTTALAIASHVTQAQFIKLKQAEQLPQKLLEDPNYQINRTNLLRQIKSAAGKEDNQENLMQSYTVLFMFDASVLFNLNAITVASTKITPLMIGCFKDFCDDLKKYPDDVKPEHLLQKIEQTNAVVALFERGKIAMTKVKQRGRSAKFKIISAAQVWEIYLCMSGLAKGAWDDMLPYELRDVLISFILAIDPRVLNAIKEYFSQQNAIDKSHGNERQ